MPASASRCSVVGCHTNSTTGTLLPLKPTLRMIENPPMPTAANNIKPIPLVRMENWRLMMNQRKKAAAVKMVIICVPTTCAEVPNTGAIRLASELT